MLGDVTKFLFSKTCWQCLTMFAFTPQANFPVHYLNFQWRWRWWDWIQANFKNLEISSSNTLRNCIQGLAKKMFAILALDWDVSQWIWTNSDNFLKISERLFPNCEQSSAFLRRPQKFGAIVLKVLMSVKTLRTMAPNFCGLLRKTEL